MINVNKKVMDRMIKICLFLLILVILITNMVQCFRSFYHGLGNYEIEHFWKYKWAFATVAKFFLEHFTAERKENEMLSQIIIDYNITAQNEIQVTYYYSGDEEPTVRLVPIGQNVIKSFNTVKRAFEQKADGKHNQFTHLTVYENFVKFDSYGPYSVFYSKYDVPPSSYNNSYFVDKMGFRWFQSLYLY